MKKASKAPKKAPAKKAVRKAPAKKAPTQRATTPAPAVTSRMRAYNLTRDIPQEKYFVLANGQPVKNVAELAAILDQLEDHVFNHHVNAERNDFHNWIRDVFEDVELAQKVAGVKDKKHLQLVIYRHIAGHDCAEYPYGYPLREAVPLPRWHVDCVNRRAEAEDRDD